ncbi:MAG: 1,2-phenylacetyl-CoA epoxidase, subunit B, partial [uncultured Corynebacteriales bacterium]
DRGGVAGVRGVRPRPAELGPRARGIAARGRRGDGAAQRARRLHPAQRGREHLGGARRPDHRRRL